MHTNTKLLQQSNGGRWPILGVYLEIKPVIDFTTLKADIDATPDTYLQGIIRSLHEVLKMTNKSDIQNYPQLITNYILHAHHKPKHHIRDIIRAVGYTIDTQGKHVEDLTYRGQR